MSETVLAIEGLCKHYTRYKSEWARIGSWFGMAFSPAHVHAVLQDVNLRIAKGEAVALIGKNGAGKSTLLKIIAGVVKPTCGRVRIKGRVSAILELGMGFHADLTGRQNVYHTAGLMGYSLDQVKQKIDEVEAFAEIGDYFDRPVRTYSSGMQMRVAFAVATMYRPEILIIDEALSIGDAYFQHKSFERIRRFQREGTTLLLVSHDTHAVLAVCNRAVLLHEGTILKDGDPQEVTDFYNALIAQKEGTTIKQIKRDDGNVQTVSGTAEATVSAVSLYNADAKVVSRVRVGEKVTLRIDVDIHRNIPTLVLGFGIKNRFGEVMYGTNTWHTEQVLHAPQKGERYRFEIVFPVYLGPGSYSVQTALTDGKTHLDNNYEWQDFALVFEVINTNKTDFIGSVWLDPTIHITKATV